MGNSEKETSKPYPIKLASNAIKDISEITDYIAIVNNQPQNAIRIGEVLFATIDRISLNPHAFRECEEVRTKNRQYRKANCFNWHIIYRIRPEEILILGIIHSSRKTAQRKKLRLVKE